MPGFLRGLVVLDFESYVGHNFGRVGRFFRETFVLVGFNTRLIGRI
jgi:hypothetical protein